MVKIDQAAKKTILVVEDEESLRMAMALVFRVNGYRVLQSSSGNEAFKIAQSEHLDVIVSDVRMPDGDGFDLVQRIRALNPEKPVLFLVTGYTDLKTEDAYDLGADALFAKPFDREALLSAIRCKLQEPRERWEWSPSVDVDNLFKVQLRVPSLGQALNGSLVKFGRGGFFLATDQAMPSEGASISFSIQTIAPPEKSFEGTGIVRWIRHEEHDGLLRGCGVEFQAIAPNSIDQIMEIISAHPTKALIPRG